MAITSKHQVVIVGGGAAGISAAARLVRKVSSIAVIEPSEFHYYQALWTLVGAGCADAGKTRRSEAKVMPKGVDWIKQGAVGFDPDNNIVETADGGRHEYDVLIVCPGIQLDWDRIPGVLDTIGRHGVSSNYTYELAPKTWDFIRSTTSGTAVFTMPSGAIKCGGAPQKIAYLACDHWRREGVLKDIDVHLVVPTPGIFGVKVFAEALMEVVADYGITLHTKAELESVDVAGRKAIFKSMVAPEEGGVGFSLPYDMMHVVPHQSAPDWVKESPLAGDTAAGYVEVDKGTHQHVRHPNVFALGDAGSTPNAKTGAAVRKQVPVVVGNVRAVLAGRPLEEVYHGYGSCPLTTARGKMLLAEFDYTMEPTPTIPFIDTTKPRTDMWYLKKYGLPFLYWNLMLKGRA